MTYRLGTALPAGGTPAADLAVLSSAPRWKTLDLDARLALVERRLRPANDRLDAFPLAL